MGVGPAGHWPVQGPSLTHRGFISGCSVVKTSDRARLRRDLVVFLSQSQGGCGMGAPGVFLRAGYSHQFPVPFFPRAGQWMETGMNGPAGAPALPVAPKAASSGLESAMVLPMEAPSARATGWRLETASCSSAQVRMPSQGSGERVGPPGEVWLWGVWGVV